MKANMSMDLKYRHSFRLDFRLDKDQMANLLALHALVYGDVGEELSEKVVMETIKKQLMYQGINVLEFGGNVDIDEEALEWAKEQINKHWKEV
jgi:hypothetical protein